MPISKKRKKKGKVVKNNSAKRARRLEEGDMSAGVTLQDLINMVAYQEFVETGQIDGPQIPDVKDIPTIADIDFDDPDVAAVIDAVKRADITENEENEDER